MKLTAIFCLLAFTAAILFSVPTATAATAQKVTALAAANNKTDDVAAAKNDKPKKSKKDKDAKDGDPDDGNAGSGNDNKTLPHDGPGND